MSALRNKPPRGGSFPSLYVAEMTLVSQTTDLRRLREIHENFLQRLKHQVQNLPSASPEREKTAAKLRRDLKSLTNSLSQTVALERETLRLLQQVREERRVAPRGATFPLDHSAGAVNDPAALGLDDNGIDRPVTVDPKPQSAPPSKLVGRRGPPRQ